MLAQSVEKLKGIGKKRAEQLAALGICTLHDVLNYFPRPGAYIDYSKKRTINELETGQPQMFKASITSVQEQKSWRGKRYARIRVKDATGYAEIYFFGTQVYKCKHLKVGMQVIVSGKIQAAKSSQSKIVSDAIIEEDKGDTSYAASILPVYSLTGNLTQNFLRSLTRQALNALNQEELAENIPEDILKKHNFLSRTAAYQNIHYPKNWQLLEAARKRLAFEELFFIQCGLLYHKNKIKVESKGYKHGFSSAKVKKLLQNLPFALTQEQKQAWTEIESDMEELTPMHRLLQGDVGSGKTVIALLALAKAVDSGYQGALMAPTEILATQHFETCQSFLAGTGINFQLLTGSTPAKEKKEVLTQLQAGELDILIGTHALIQENVQFKNLSLVVTDEQHRFGVRQRAGLAEKSLHVPDTLVMTATPIPRTMALTVYGDLDISLIKELPPGRKPIITLCYNDKKREAVYQGVVRQVKLGRQAYIVCPLIEESETINSLSASGLYEYLKGTFLQDIPTALLHGRLKSGEKDAIMTAFSKNELKVLISTTVIEVGINVPNATLMIVEGADRFGLSQLHQLRGRIGRGEHQSYCALITDSNNEQTLARLQLLSTHSDGFALAEEDLKLRGSGELFGTRQHGLPDLRLANIFTDTDLLLLSRKCAQKALQEPQQVARIKAYIKSNYEGNFAAIFSS